jgi:hypothetical protein
MIPMENGRNPFSGKGFAIGVGEDQNAKPLKRKRAPSGPGALLKERKEPCLT